MKTIGLISVGLVCTLLGNRADPPKDALPVSAITLKGRHTLADALAAVHKQTGNAVVDLRGQLGQEIPNPELALDLNAVTFWPALDRIAEKAGVQVYPYVDPQTRKPAVGIVGPDPANGKTSPLRLAYSGPFRFVVKRLHRQRERLNVTLELACEPRFEPLLLRMAKDGVKHGDTSDTLKVAGQAGVGTVKLLGESPVELTLQLPMPQGATKLAELRCEWLALVHPERLSFEFDKLAAGEKVVNRGVHVTLGRIDVDPRAGRTRLGIAVEYPKGSLDLESHQTWAAEGHEIILKSKTGNRELRPSGEPLLSVDEGGPMRITYALSEPIKPTNWSLVYRAPATPVRVPLRVSFKDLRVP